MEIQDAMETQTRTAQDREAAAIGTSGNPPGTGQKRTNSPTKTREEKGHSLAFDTFITNYSDLISGQWRKLWDEAQTKGLPKHLIVHDNPEKGILCTCGKGPFKTITQWSKHATKTPGRRESRRDLAKSEE